MKLNVPRVQQFDRHAILQQPPRVHQHRDIEIRVIVGRRMIGQGICCKCHGAGRSIEQIIALQLVDENRRRQRKGGGGILPLALLVGIDHRAGGVLMLLPEIDIRFDELQIIAAA